MASSFSERQYRPVAKANFIPAWRASSMASRFSCMSCLSLLMNVLWLFHGETVLQIANKICPNMTCCADCHIDDMCHVGGCEIDQEAEEIVKKLCREDSTLASIHAILDALDNLASDLAGARADLAELEGE